MKNYISDVRAVCLSHFGEAVPHNNKQLAAFIDVKFKQLDKHSWSVTYKAWSLLVVQYFLNKKRIAVRMWRLRKG